MKSTSKRSFPRNVAVLAATAVLATAGVAEAGKGGKPNANTASSAASVSVALLDPGATTPTFGGHVTFNVSTTEYSKWVEARCYQGGTLVYSETRGFFPEYPGQEYTLGPTGYWTGGAASCVGELFTVIGSRRIALATTAFDVVG